MLKLCFHITVIYGQSEAGSFFMLSKVLGIMLIIDDRSQAIVFERILRISAAQQQSNYAVARRKEG